MTNPYAPPATRTADPEVLPPDPAGRPRQVVVAVWLLWIAFATSVLAPVLAAWREPEEDGYLMLIATNLLALAVAVLLNVYIYRGRNWARLIFLLLYVAAVVLTALAALFFPDAGMLGAGVEEIVLNLLTYTLDLAALMLLYTGPGARWFRHGEPTGDW